MKLAGKVSSLLITSFLRCSILQIQLFHNPNGTEAHIRVNSGPLEGILRQDGKRQRFVIDAHLRLSFRPIQQTQ